MSNIYDMADTWNAGATTFTAIKMNVTDTASATASLLMDLQVGGVSKLRITKGGMLDFYTGTQSMNIYSSGDHLVLAPNNSPTLGLSKYNALTVPSAGLIGFTSSIAVATGQDCGFVRSAAGVVGVCGANSTTGGALEYIEQTAPSAPSADRVRIYAQDNGAGKTQLMALFSSGAAQQIAIQP